MNAKLSYNAQIVHEHDPDRFLLTMLMPSEFHEDLLVLFAFYYEIAKTREVVSETVLGQIRLKWWQEGIEGIYKGGAVREHETLQALAGVIARRGLSYEYFETLIYAREFDLEDVLPGNLEGLVNYCDFTLSPLLKLVMQVMGDEPEGGEPVQLVAVNYALVGLLRALPFYARGARCLLPEDLMAKHGVDKSDLYNMKPGAGLPNLVRDSLDVYEGAIRPRNKFLKASQILAQIYYRQIRSNGHDVFEKRMALGPPFKALRLAFAYKFL
jgi:phytoene synthase